MIVPRDIQSLVKYLKESGEVGKLANNLITQWGPKGKTMLSAEFLPPRAVGRNQDTIERVHFRTVAATDGTRHSPAQIVDGGELFGKINYRLGHSDIARQIVGPDYDGLVNFLRQNLGMAAAGRVVGIFDTFILQAMVEHDELANWEAIVFNKISRRGDNAYYEYEDGPDLSGHRVSASVDWTNPAVDPWASDIQPRIDFLVNLGFERSGIRIVTTDRVKQTLAAHPATLRRSYAGVPLFTGQDIDEVAGFSTTTDVDRVLAKLGVRSAQTHDLRIMTRTGQKRAYPESHMTFIASTGRTEELLYNTDNPADVKIIEDTLGFNAIGVANGQQDSGRRTALRAFTDQKDARIEMEGWQATGPVILEPTAITDIDDIELG